MGLWSYIARLGYRRKNVVDAFLSYSRIDEDSAREIAARLHSEGIVAWWDKKLLAGDKFSDVIHSLLKRSRSVVILWSAESRTSTWVKHEASIGRYEQKAVPVTLDGENPPPPHDEIHSANLINWNGSASDAELSVLVDAVRAKLNRTQGASPQLSFAEYNLRNAEAAAKVEATQIENGKLRGTAQWAKLLRGNESALSEAVEDIQRETVHRRKVIASLCVAIAFIPFATFLALGATQDVTPEPSRKIFAEDEEHENDGSPPIQRISGDTGSTTGDDESDDEDDIKLPMNEPESSVVNASDDLRAHESAENDSAFEFSVQVAAFRSTTAAQAAYAGLLVRHPNLMEGQPVNVQKADLGDKGVFYRLRIGIFDNRGAAKAFCGELKQVGENCLVVAASSG